MYKEYTNMLILSLLYILNTICRLAVIHETQLWLS